MTRASACLVLLVLGCGSPDTEIDTAAIQAEVREMTTAISRDLASGGPNSWLDHFLDDEAFFMASDGRMLFPSYDSARVFIGGFAPGVTAIDLRWHHIRVDVLSSEQAVLAADYTEVISDTTGAHSPFRGYFTGLAQRTDSGWKLRHAHWSSPPQSPEQEDAAEEAQAN
jgi:ketosteroid isomerase-like protein